MVFYALVVAVDEWGNGVSVTVMGSYSTVLQKEEFCCRFSNRKLLRPASVCLYKSL